MVLWSLDTRQGLGGQREPLPQGLCWAACMDHRLWAWGSHSPAGQSGPSYPGSTSPTRPVVEERKVTAQYGLRTLRW